MDKITPAGAFGFYAGLCLIGWIFVMFCFPETAGLSLEEVKMVFRNGFGIGESKRLIADKKAMKNGQHNTNVDATESEPEKIDSPA